MYALSTADILALMIFFSKYLPPALPNYLTLKEATVIFFAVIVYETRSIVFLCLFVSYTSWFTSTVKVGNDTVELLVEPL